MKDLEFGIIIGLFVLCLFIFFGVLQINDNVDRLGQELQNDYFYQSRTIPTLIEWPSEPCTLYIDNNPGIPDSVYYKEYNQTKPCTIRFEPGR